MIQRENEVVAEKRSEAEASAGSGSYSGAGYSSPGSSAGVESGGSGESSGESKEGFLSGGDPETADSGGGGSDGSAKAVEEEAGIDPEHEKRIPEDVGDGSNDDIVARQLREAAMEEEDPELRERLWDEYRRYKSSSKSGD